MSGPPHPFYPHGVSDVLSIPPPPFKVVDPYNLQKERVQSARQTLSNLKDATSNSPDKVTGGGGGKVVSVRYGEGGELAGHRIIDNAMAAKYPGAKWEVKQANFYDFEDLRKRRGDLRDERRKLVGVRRDLVRRLEDGRVECRRLEEKKRMLANAREMKDFRIDLGGGEEGRDGWLRVNEPPNRDPIAKQLHTLELKLLNKEMAKSMSAIESFAGKEEGMALEAEGRLRRRKERLESFPTKAILDIGGVRRMAIRLIEEKGELETRREEVKRNSGIKMQEARSKVRGMRDVLEDSREELGGLREDLRYWEQRLKLERVKIEPVKLEVERLKEELIAVSNAEGIEGGWGGVAAKAAFLIGCNMDVVEEGRLDGEDGKEALRFEDVVDKIRGGRIVGVMRDHLWPPIKASVGEVREACDAEGIWYDEERFEDSKFGDGDFVRIIRRVGETRERGEE